MKRNGFTIYYKGKDYFFVTNRKNVTETFIKEICRHLEIPDNQWGKHEVRYRLLKATIEEKATGNGQNYYNISGRGFTIIDFPGNRMEIVELD